jgi:hypothetical protein
MCLANAAQDLYTVAQEDFEALGREITYPDIPADEGERRLKGLACWST